MVSYTTNKTEQARRGQKEMHVPMEVDHVSGSKLERDWEHVDEVSKGIVEGLTNVKGKAELEARDT